MHVNPDRLIRARKEHRCDLCGLRIRKGAQHAVRTGVDGREHWRMRMHIVCRELTYDWDELNWECGWDEHDFRHYELQLRPTTVPNLVLTIIAGPGAEVV